MAVDLAAAISGVMPRCRAPKTWAAALGSAMRRFGVSDDKDVLAVLLAQLAVESQEMNRLEENLSYTAARLVAVWPRRFPSVQAAAPCARNPQALANFVYANRMGNGNPESGDGYKYRGRGLKMITGKDNYRRCGAALGVDLLQDPNHLLTTQGAADSALWFWTAHGLSRLADDLPGDNADADFVSVTRIINGGVTGLDQRRAYWTRAKAVLK